MISKIQNKFTLEEHKRLLSNFISLSILQGANYILPFITLPYLVRVLGVKYFGLLAFATATIAYFGIITDYGFNLTATREVSIHRDNKEKLIEIFSSVMTIKIILMFLSFILLSGLVFSFEKFYQNYEVYFLTFGTVIGQTFFPIWFFQGMERMKYTTYLNILAKSIFTIAIFIFVNGQSDYWIVPLLTSIGFIIAGVWSLFLIKTEFGIDFRFQKVDTLKSTFIEGWHIFISNVAISLYTVSTTFILGIFTNNTIVGYFAAADKIIQAFKGLMGPVSQTIYPYINRKVHSSKKEGLDFIKKVFKYVGIFTGIISIFILVFANFLINFFLGTQYQNSVIVLEIMAILPFLIGLSNICGIQTMLTFGRKKQLSKILIMGSILNFILSFILVPIYHYIGSAFSVVIVESFITIAMFIYLQKNGLKMIGENKFV